MERADKEIPDWTSIYTDFSERDSEDYLKPIGRFYERPDVDFLDADGYLVREEEGDAGDDTWLENDAAVDGICYDYRYRGHLERNDGLGERGLEQNESSTISPKTTANRTRAGFTIENKRPTVANTNYSDGIDTFSHVGLLKGAHSYILNRKGMKLIMDYYLEHKIFIPYAQEIQIIPGMHPYCTPEPITKNTNRG
jgi:hypothetical protein